MIIRVTIIYNIKRVSNTRIITVKGSLISETKFQQKVQLLVASKKGTYSCYMNENLRVKEEFMVRLRIISIPTPLSRYRTEVKF